VPRGPRGQCEGAAGGSADATTHAGAARATTLGLLVVQVWGQGPRRRRLFHPNGFVLR
jgi:hypothetical protein